MADASAAVLVEVLLASDRGQAAAILSEQLLADPPLVLWAVCRSWEADRLHPRSVEAVAEWLVARALDCLQWESFDGEGFDVPDDGVARTYSPQVAAALETADMAALLSSSEGLAASEEAFLWGLLSDPEGWLAGAGGGWEEGLPPWLAGGEGPAAGWVDQAIEVLAEPAAARPEWDIEGCRRRAREGSRRWLEPLAGAGDHLPALARKLARLRSLETRFDELVEREKLAAMAEFAAGAGHEINNPLAIIGGRAQLLLKDEPDPERRRELALMIAQVKRAHEMIADIRLFARPPQPEWGPVDLVELAERVVEDFRPEVARQASAIRRTGRREPLVIQADAAQLNVALRAVCRNALEAIGHDGQIEVGVTARGDEAVLRVADDGPGIPPPERGHLFDPFYSSRQAGRGLGTGLSKCWRIVTGHGGRIDVGGEPGRGAVLTICLPRRAAAPTTAAGRPVPDGAG